MITNCSSPLTNGLSAYFLWNQAIDSVVLGNTVVNSIHEHIIRSSGAAQQLIAYNNFTNNDGKGCIEVHEGSYAWVEGNIVTNGDIRVGPLGLWGEPVTQITQYAVIQGNTVNNVSINVDPGSDDISIRNNIIYRNTGMMVERLFNRLHRPHLRRHSDSEQHRHQQRHQRKLRESGKPHIGNYPGQQSDDRPESRHRRQRLRPRL